MHIYEISYCVYSLSFCSLSESSRPTCMGIANKLFALDGKLDIVLKNCKMLIDAFFAFLIVDLHFHHMLIYHIRRF